MILFDTKYDIQKMVEGQLQPKLIQYMKPENLTNGKGKIDKIKNELEAYLFQNMTDGESRIITKVTKTVKKV